MKKYITLKKYIKNRKNSKNSKNRKTKHKIRKNKTIKKINKKRYGGDECKYENTDPDWNENKEWPKNYGCTGDMNEKEIILPVNKILDRIGWSKGYFFGEPGYSYDSRSLRIFKKNPACKNQYDGQMNNGIFPNRIEYRQYSVLKPFSVMSCSAKAFFGHNGGSVQYRLFEHSLPDQTDREKISEKKDIADADGNIKQAVKVPCVEELLMLGYIKETPILNLPDFM